MSTSAAAISRLRILTARLAHLGRIALYADAYDRSDPDYQRRLERALDRCQAQLHTVTLLLADMTTAATLGKALTQLVEGAELLTVFRSVEVSEGDGLPPPPTFHATALVGDGTPARTAVRSDLAQALLALGGQEPTKACRRCEQVLDLTCFSQNKDNQDGRCRYCKVCERARVAEYTRRRLEAKILPVAEPLPTLVIGEDGTLTVAA